MQSKMLQTECEQCKKTKRKVSRQRTKWSKRYRQTFEQLVDLRSEHENLKRKNKITEELRDKAENERDELQLQNDILKNKLQKLKHLILTKF